MSSTIEQAILELTKNNLNEDSVKRIVKETTESAGYLTDYQAKALIEDMRAELVKSSGVSESRVKEILQNVIHEVMGQLPPKEIVVNLDGIKTKFEGEFFHKEFETILKCLAAGIPCMAVGGKGTGKSYMGNQLARALNVDFEPESPILSPYQITGSPLADGSVIRTPARNAFEHGRLLMIDEGDASEPRGMVGGVNPLLSNGVMSFAGQVVKKHENFKCFMTANTYGKGATREFVGRCQLDDSTLDRFAVVNVGYDNALERNLAQNDSWVDFVQSVRTAIYDLDIREGVSMRASIDGAKLLRTGLDHKTVAEMVVWKGMAKATRDKIKKHVGA